MTTNGQPTPPNVNLELTQNLRRLLESAARGQIGSIMVVGTDDKGNMIKLALTQDAHLYTVFTALAMMQDAIKFRLTQIEHQAAQSLIQRALHMPGGG